MDWLQTVIEVEEVALIVVSMIGMLLATYAFADYIGDMIDLGDRNGFYRMTGAIGVRTSGIVLGVFILFEAYGILAFLAAPPADGRAIRSLISLSFSLAIVLILILLKALNLRDRLRLRLQLAGANRPGPKD